VAIFSFELFPCVNSFFVSSPNFVPASYFLGLDSSFFYDDESGMLKEKHGN
jgi:hypothetical protein